MTDDKKQRPEPISIEKLTGGAPTAARHAEHDDHAPDLERRCREIADRVNQELQHRHFNIMKKCEGEYRFEWCQPLRMAEIEPVVFVLWGDSPCDCIEGDDTEIMSVVVLNPYSNLAFSHFTINRIVVVNADGTPVPLLPDQSPSIQLVPLGPYCFDDIGPCSWLWRQFSVRLRGAPPGSYRILLQGICFEACFHQLKEECFTFDVCRD
jgi:hypothetical protein